MTRNAQQRDELRSVEQMRSLLSDFPNGTLDHRGEPDVWIVGTDRCIGVEVTELYRQPQPGKVPRRLLESEWGEVVVRARLFAEVANVPVVYVAVHFNENMPIRKPDRDSVARALADIVSRNVPALDRSVEIQPWQEHNEVLRCVNTLGIHRFAMMTRHFWSVPDGGWVQLDFAAELQQAIDRKNALYTEYMQRCDECWLLVTASGGRASGLFEASDDTRLHVYQSRFSRTFFLEVFGGKLAKLKTAFP